MPIVAVVAAVAIDAGVIAGGISAITTLGAITAIGATIGAIGAVTGNKDLALAGGALGLVGGIGSLASNAGIFDDATSFFGSAPSDTTSAAVSDAFNSTTDAAVQDAINSANSGANITPAATAGIDITTATGGINEAAVNPVSGIEAATAPTEGNAAAIEAGGQGGSPLAQSLSPSATPASSGANATSFTDQSTGAITQTQAPALGPTFGSGQIPASMATAPALGAATNAPPGFLTSLLQWGKNNPMLAYGITQAGGSFISGLTNPMTPAQINALNAQADANRAAAALSARETANASQSLPKAGITSPAIPAPGAKPAVTGAPAGLINTRPVASPLITGAPAAQLASSAPQSPIPIGAPG